MCKTHRIVLNTKARIGHVTVDATLQILSDVDKPTTYKRLGINVGSFLIGTGVTLVVPHSADLEALRLNDWVCGTGTDAQPCLYLLIYCRHITADIRIPLTTWRKKGKKLRYIYGGIRPCCFRQQKCVTVCAVEIQLPGMPKFLVERCRTDARNAVHGKACRAFSCGKL